jgi:hypothetical protein
MSVLSSQLHVGFSNLKSEIGNLRSKKGLLLAQEAFDAADGFSYFGGA